MRKYKFRVWDKKIKTMLSWKDCLREFELSDMFEGSNKNLDIEVMQFTELLDNSGKEIYEGDIIAIIDKNNKGLIGIVKYYEREFKAVNIKEETGNTEDFALDDVLDYQRKIIGIIGNLYENPKLLETVRMSPLNET